MMILFVQTMTVSSVYEEPICSCLASLSSKLVSVPIFPPASFQTDCPILTISAYHNHMFVCFIHQVTLNFCCCCCFSLLVLLLLLFVCLLLFFLLPDFVSAFSHFSIFFPSFLPFPFIPSFWRLLYMIFFAVKTPA